MGDKPEFTELDWITLKNDISSPINLPKEETPKEKFLRKFNENPFVPLGCGLTATALIYGLWSFKSGQRRTSQQMMRLRVVAQGFTVAALLVGIATSIKK